MSEHPTWAQMPSLSQTRPPASLPPHSAVGWCRAASRSLRAQHSLVRSDCSLLQQQRAHDACPAAGVHGPVLHFGSPSIAVVSHQTGWRNRNDEWCLWLLITVLLVSSSCCWLGPWRRVALPAAGWPVLASWTGALLGALLPPRCPARLPGSRSTARPQGTAPAPAPAGLSRAGAGLRQSGPRAPAWHGSAGRGHGGAAPLALPARGQESPAEARLPLPTAPGPPRPAPPTPAGSAARPCGEQPRAAAAGLGSGPFGTKCPGCRGGRGNPFRRESSQGLWPFQKAGTEPSWSWHGPNPSGDGTPGCCRACRSAHGAVSGARTVSCRAGRVPKGAFSLPGKGARTWLLSAAPV